MKAMERNRVSTATLCDISSKTLALQSEVTNFPGTKAELDQVKGDATTARSRWRIMKSVVAAIVAGSGVDWAQDDTLRDLVLDAEG